MLGRYAPALLMLQKKRCLRTETQGYDAHEWRVKVVTALGGLELKEALDRRDVSSKDEGTKPKEPSGKRLFGLFAKDALRAFLQK